MVRYPNQHEKTSYKVSTLIAKAKNPHTVGEELVKPATVLMARKIYGADAKENLAQVPL